MNKIEYNKEYYENNKEQILVKNKEYRENNKEQLLIKRKEYYQNNKNILTEKNKEYRENNKEQLLVKSKEYYENNKDIHTEKNKDYYKNNKEQLLVKRKEYYEKNKEKIREKQKEYNENNKEHILVKSKEYRKKNKEHIKEKRKCRSCKLFIVTLKPYLCSYCNPDKATRQKTKEMAVKTFLEECNYTFIYNKKCNLDKSCQTYYPDFVIDCNNFFVIIECDEYGHKNYDKSCEKIRENNICFALGLPCVFIRFNPDKKNIKMKTKQKILKNYIDYYINKEMCDNGVEYLFY